MNYIKLNLRLYHRLVFFPFTFLVHFTVILSVELQDSEMEQLCTKPISQKKYQENVKVTSQQRQIKEDRED